MLVISISVGQESEIWVSDADYNSAEISITTDGGNSGFIFVIDADPQLNMQITGVELSESVEEVGILLVINDNEISGYSAFGQLFPAGEYVLLNISWQMEEVSGWIYINSEESYYLNACEILDFMLGDVNDDSLLNVLDIVFVIGVILNDELFTQQQICSFDWNGDELIDILDIIEAVAEIISPDPEENIAFISDRTGTSQIFMMTDDGSVQRNITNNEIFNRNITFSPDGISMIYFSYVPIEFGWEQWGVIKSINLEDSIEFQLTEDYSNYKSLDYSPDGSKIVFVLEIYLNFNMENDIYIMNSDGSNQTNLTNNPGMDRFSQFSPDGTKILFTSNRSGAAELYTMNYDGSEVTNLTNTPTDSEYNAQYSPDGERITYVSDMHPGDGVHIMDSDGNNNTLITLSDCNPVTPRFSPDSSLLVDSNCFENSNKNIYLTNLSNMERTNLTNREIPDYSPVFNSDGTKILFSSNQGSIDIWSMNLDGSNQINMTNNSANDYSAIIRPIN